MNMEISLLHFNLLLDIERCTFKFQNEKQIKQTKAIPILIEVPQIKEIIMIRDCFPYCCRGFEELQSLSNRFQLKFLL